MKFQIKGTLIGAWLAWCLWWFADGACSLIPACKALLKPVHVAERTMADVLVLALSGFPSGLYMSGLLGDYVVGPGKLAEGLLG